MTAQKKKSERVTKEKILKAIEGGAKSLTAVSKALGFKGSVSGSTAKRIRELVPDIEERMKSAGSKREGKKTRKAQSTIEIPDICPFRSSSSYAVLWTILFNNRKKGITRAKLIERGVKMTGKAEKNIRFDCCVVSSPDSTGKAHRSANKAADSYWVEKSEGGNLKLHMRD